MLGTKGSRCFTPSAGCIGLGWQLVVAVSAVVVRSVGPGTTYFHPFPAPPGTPFMGFCTTLHAGLHAIQIEEDGVESAGRSTWLEPRRLSGQGKGRLLPRTRAVVWQFYASGLSCRPETAVSCLEEKVCGPYQQSRSLSTEAPYAPPLPATPNLPPLCPPSNGGCEGSFKVQQISTKDDVKQGDRLVGYKLGNISKVSH